MKIKFSYQPGEEKRAYLVCNLVIVEVDGNGLAVKAGSVTVTAKA